MGQRQLAAVLFAVVGVFIAISRLPEVFLHAFNLLVGDPPRDGGPSATSWRSIIGLAFAASLLSTAIGVVLVLIRNRLAAWLFPPASGELVIRDAQAVALSILGCYLFVQGISRSFFPGPMRWAAGIQVVLGAALFLGARGLAGLWASWRSAGTSSFSSESRDG